MYTIVIPRHKKTRLQDEILRLIIENGEQSSTTILNNFKNTEFEGVERTSIVRTLSKLTIDEKISITNFEKKSGGKGRIFNLAKKEFKKIIE